jgi:hypothetical protein
MEYLTKKNLDENIHIILGVLIVILVILFIIDSYSKPLPSSMYPFKGLLDKQISKDQFEMLKKNYDNYAIKFLTKMNNKLKNYKSKIIKNDELYPILNETVKDLWNDLSKKSEIERTAVTNMFISLNSNIKDLDKLKIKESIKNYYFGPLPEILINN